MSKLEKYLAKSQQTAPRKEITVTIEGEEWKVRQLTLTESRACERMVEQG